MIMQRRAAVPIFAVPLAMFFAIFLALSGGAGAQTPSASPDPAASRTLDAATEALKGVDMSLESHAISDADLTALHAKIAPLAPELQATLDHLNMRLAAVQARLAQLGPAPAANAAPENPQIAKERQQQSQDYAAIDALAKRTGLLLVQAQQADKRIAARQRAKFTHSLLEHSQSLVDPELWRDVAGAAPRALGQAQDAIAERLRAIDSGLAGWRLPFFWVIIVAGLVLLQGSLARLAAAHLAPAQADPWRINTAAWLRALAVAAPPFLALLLIAALSRFFGVLDAATSTALWSIARAIAYVAIAAGIAAALLMSGPGQVLWFSQTRGRQARRAIIGIAALIALSHLAVALFEAANADPAFQNALRGTAASFVAFAIIAALWQANAGDCGSDEIFGPRVTGSRDWYAILRSLLWLAAVAILAAAAFGYMRLACFLADQVYWIGATGAIAFMLYGLVEAAIAAGCRPTARFGRALMASFGPRSETVEQLAILLAGAATVTIFIAAVLTVLAPWGVQSSDLPTYLRAAFFGFRVGDITISLAAVVVALLIFIAGSMATHTVERWLDQSFLPATRLDFGLRNAIKTSFGYFGFILALGFGLAYLGLNFERLAIVAGALSVGIGFGLQSIVNNFVSGLIVLWERAIRVGDWIVVGSDEGVVSRISVRATEIATFDRAAVIIPNSNLITGVVKNFVRTDRSGRIQITIPVNAAADPEVARRLLTEIAKDNPLVLETPAPQVVFSGITAASFNFDLFCFVGDVATLGAVKSDLNFAIYRRFKEAGLFAAPPPETVVTLAGLDKWAPLFGKPVAPDGLGNESKTG